MRANSELNDKAYPHRKWRGGGNGETEQGGTKNYSPVRSAAGVKAGSDGKVGRFFFFVSECIANEIRFIFSGVGRKQTKSVGVFDEFGDAKLFNLKKKNSTPS